MHFTIPNSHILNFSVTKLYPQEHSTNHNFSSFTIYMVIYSTFTDTPSPPTTTAKNFARQTASLGAYLLDREFFVPCTVTERPWPRRVLESLLDSDQDPPNSSNSLFSGITCSQVFVFSTSREDRGVFTHALTAKEFFPQRKVVKGENSNVFISTTCFKGEIIFRAF